MYEIFTIRYTSTSVEDLRYHFDISENNKDVESCVLIDRNVTNVYSKTLFSDVNVYLHLSV